MNQSQGNLEIRGYAHTGNRELTPDEKAGMRREGMIRILISVVLWLLFPFCLFTALAILAVLTDGGRNTEDTPGFRWLLRIGLVPLALEFLAALTQTRRGRNLRADARAGVVNVYSWRPLANFNQAPLQWKGIDEPVADVELLPRSERVWRVNGQLQKNGWDALRPSYLLDKLGLRPVK